MGRPGLNLLYFSRGYTPHDHRFLASFAAAGARVAFLRWDGGDAARLDARPLPSGIEAVDWPEGRLPSGSRNGRAARLRGLERVLGERRPGVVLAGPVPTAAALVAEAGYRPLVAMSWGSDLLVEAARSAAVRRAARSALRHATGAFGDCQAVRGRIRTLSSLPESRIVTFPWGIDLGVFSPPARPRPSGRPPVLVSTRSWEPPYAIPVLLGAFARFRAGHPGARLILAGDGSERDRIRRILAQERLRGSVETPGRLGYGRLPGLFRSADLYVSSALSDGTSISLLEAMATGLPAVVTSGYGNPEWVRPGVNGWLARPGDGRDLARALEAAFAARGRWRAIGDGNVRTVRRRADWNRNFPALLDLLVRAQAEGRAA